MLQPARRKYRKEQKGRNTGISHSRGTAVSFGEFGLKAIDRGRITAQDSQPDRLGLIRENCARLGVTCVEASVAPSGIIANPAKKFDRVLVDAPCSNTGVMRHRVDVKWRLQEGDFQRHARPFDTDGRFQRHSKRPAAPFQYL